LRATPSSRAAMAVVKAGGSCIKIQQNLVFPVRLDPRAPRA
jgi:hypothetical protein